MIKVLRDKIAYYVAKNSNILSWKNVRENYGYYSYLAFLCLAVYELESTLDYKKLKDISQKYNIEDSRIIDFVMGIKDAKEFVQDILNMTNCFSKIDIIDLYQNYLAQDFIVSDQIIRFQGGKNNRDILGSYYTQEEFAYEITKKAIDDFFSKDQKQISHLKVADFSCGGGAFLISAVKVCKEKGLSIETYGYDVDPIAVLITRLRLIKIAKLEMKNIRIKLGNPLLAGLEMNDTVEVFRMAAVGRYYNSLMETSIKEKMDVIVGNPPWEKIRFEEKKFLHHYLPDIELGTKTERENQIKKIEKNNLKFYNSLFSDYGIAKRKIKSSSFFSRSNCGELNTYALFTELSLNMIKDKGVTSLIVKSSLVKMPVYSDFFRKITRDKNLYELYMFVNRKKVFNIDSREEFCVVYLTNNKGKGLKVSLDLEKFIGFTKAEKLAVSYRKLNLLNPETGMLPNIKNNDDLKFLVEIYEKNRTFQTVFPSCKFGRLVHLTNHSSAISKKKGKNNLQIYEGKFIEIYTGKYATFRDVDDNVKYKNKAAARLIEDELGNEYPEARFYIQKDVWQDISKKFEGDYIVAWRSLTSATNRRTMLATLLPKVPTCQSIQLLQMSEVKDMVHVLALFNSIVFDYIVRLKMVGLDLTQTIIKQIPVPSNKKYAELIKFEGISATIDTHISSRISFLYENDYRLAALFKNVEKYVINKPRKKIIAELDKLVAILYEIDEITLKQIALTFDKFYSKEEVENYF